MFSYSMLSFFMMRVFIFMLSVLCFHFHAFIFSFHVSRSSSSSSSLCSRSNSSYRANVGPPGPFCEPPGPHENRAGSNEITTFSRIVAKNHDPEKGENVVISLLSARFS